MLVYVATFANGKKYVGATSRTLERRVQDHMSSSAAGVRNKLYNAARKYGWGAVSWGIVGTYQSAPDMFKAEIDLIKSLDSQRVGYNTTSGGQGNPGRIVSDQERARISTAQRRRFSDQNARVAVSKAMSNWVKNNPEKHQAYAEKRAESVRRPDRRAAISSSLKKFFDENPGLLSAQSKKLYAERPEVREKISKTLGGAPVTVWKDGNVVRVFPTLSQCARDLNLRIGNIGMVLNGKRNHTGGYFFTRDAA